MSKTERTARSVWEIVGKSRDDLIGDYDEQQEVIKRQCRALARWHLRALARARREERKAWQKLITKGTI